MQLSAAVLCDFASVREGLLMIIGGGVTNLWRDELPAPMGCSVALLLALHPMEFGRPHEIEVLVQDEDGRQIAHVQGGFTAGTDDVTPGDHLNVPLALDLRNVVIDNYGRFAVNIGIDGTHQAAVTFRVGAHPEGSRGP